MDTNIIKEQEQSNDGQSIFLYYDAMAGVYLAFGLSAYYATLVTEPYMSYSEAMEMPVALLRRQHINIMRQSLQKNEHTVKQFYRFQLRNQVGRAGYDKWAEKQIQRHLSVKS